MHLDFHEFATERHPPSHVRFQHVLTTHLLIFADDPDHLTAFNL